MSDADPILLDLTAGVAHLRFNRPKVLNALDEHMILAFRRAVETLAEDPAVRVVVLSGEGRGFLAGGDVGRFHAAGADAPKVVEALIGPFHEALRMLTSLRQPVLASLHGPVAGAGLSIALAADLAIAADDARFTLAYSRIGTSPDGGASWSLPRTVGLRKALELALLSDAMDAQEALRLGIVNKVVAAGDLRAETEALARRLADGATFAFGQIKALMRASFETSLSDQLHAEQRAFQACAASRDFAEGTSAFVAKRAPVFEGH